MATAESLLVSAVIKNRNKRELSKANFTSDNMAKYKDEMFFILESQNVPSSKAFKAKFPRFILQPIPDTDIPVLIKQCKDNKIKADLSKLLLDSASGIRNGEDPKKILFTLERQSRNIDSQFSNVEDIDVFGKMTTYFERYLEKRRKVKAGSTIGVPYGIKTIDKLAEGMHNKELITIAARTKVGKTWIMCKMAASAIMAGYPTLYLSLEMDWDAIANRIFSVISYELAIQSAKSKKRKDKEKEINSNILFNADLNLGKMDERKVAKILKEIKRNVKTSLYVPDIKGKFSIASSQRRIETLKPEIVFFDYFGLTQNGNSNGKGIENWVQASDASKLAKEIARTYNLPYVLGAQLNRTGAQADSPKLEHISLTDSIGQDSDKVFMLKTMGRRNRLQVICEKFRGGADGWKINLDFDVNKGRLVETGVQGVDELEDEFD